MWSPAHERHAIERVSVTIRFSEPVPMKFWSSLTNDVAAPMSSKGLDTSADEFEANFTPALMQGGFPQSFSVGPNGVHIGGQNHSLQVAGKLFRKVNGSEVREEVQFHRNRFVYATSIYDGWDAFIERMLDLGQSYTQSALLVTSLGSVQLEYWDRFTYRGPKEEADFSSLLRNDSRFIPSYQTEVRDLWHSHMGFFVETQNDARRLVNFNVDVIDAEEEAIAGDGPEELRSVGLYSMARDTYEDGGSPETFGEALSTLNQMHSILKNVLTDAITSETARRISLNDQVAP